MKSRKSNTVLNILTFIGGLLATFHIILERKHGVFCYVGFVLVIIGFILAVTNYLKYKKTNHTNG